MRLAVAWSDVAEAEDLSELEFTHHADSPWWLRPRPPRDQIWTQTWIFGAPKSYRYRKSHSAAHTHGGWKTICRSDKVFNDPGTKTNESVELSVPLVLLETLFSLLRVPRSELCPFYPCRSDLVRYMIGTLLTHECLLCPWIYVHFYFLFFFIQRTFCM